MKQWPTIKDCSGRIQTQGNLQSWQNASALFFTLLLAMLHYKECKE